MDLLKTPFHHLHVAAGARMVPFAGFDMPVQYEGILQEHATVRRSVGLFDVSHMGEARFRGPDALKAVSRIVTNDVFSLVDGQARYNVMCNEQGGIVDDVVVYRLAADDVLVCINAANREKDVRWMQDHLEGDVAFANESDDWAQVAVQGRNAQATLAKLTDVDLSAIDTYHFASGATVAGIQGCIVARTGYTGEDGFEVFAPADRAEPLWNAILEAGAPFGIAPIGLGARDTLRLEVRYPLYGHELTDETSPWQAGVGWTVQEGKEGGFVGQEALAERKGNESHRLVGLELEGKRIARDGMSVVLDGEEVGHVTSGTRSPSVEKGIALAYVRRDLFRPGTRLQIDVRGRLADAVVVKGPFYKRDY